MKTPREILSLLQSINQNASTPEEGVESALQIIAAVQREAGESCSPVSLERELNATRNEAHSAHQRALAASEQLNSLIYDLSNILGCNRTKSDVISEIEKLKDHSSDSLRAHLAGQALQGILASLPESAQQALAELPGSGRELLAKGAVNLADSLIRQLNMPVDNPPPKP